MPLQLLLGLAILAVVFWIAIDHTRDREAPSLYCGHCGDVGEAVTPGSIWLEIGLWCVAVLPGMLYTVWRAIHRGRACGHCGHDALMPLSAPVAQRALEARRRMTVSTGPVAVSPRTNT